ncbi:efflux RND transporter periplasmic adaptor subunit [Microbulbifer taiwanensis]|uniref:Efflux RND transporter periplasmic adaptor subunit n=1 Tax=Microbulbifer taiwanensis TaxID=986746 RepID=A0ABW1YHI3_9GAMM|nr:efflux RND transporter periplasmic adaptor subunit [Microbulbifer taiwanensis]
MLKKLNWNFVIPIALILLALLISSWLMREKPTLSRGERRAPAPTVDVVVAERGQFPLRVRALGRVTARETVDLQPQVEGRVEWIDYDLGPGSTLQSDQLLLRIEAEPYQLALQTARSTLAERRAELQQERGQRLVAEEEYELLGTSLPQADRALVLREPQLAAAEARVDAAEAQVGLAQRDLRLTQIRSPITALLVSRNVDIGDRVAPGSVLYTLAGAERFQIEVEVPASQLERLNSPNAEVRIRGSQWPEGKYRRGEFVRVIPVLEEQGRLARVLVELTDPLAIEDAGQPQLLLNDLARVEITGRAARERVRVPLTAVQDGDRVWQVRDNRIVVRPIEIAYLSGDYAVLESGLSGGERLVTTRLTTVTDGMPVQVADEVEVQPQRGPRKKGGENRSGDDASPLPSQGERG